QRQDLLDVKGHIIEEGWARRPIWRYKRDAIHSGAIRIKEWDYYAVMSHAHQCAICATFSDLGFAALFAIAFIDMKRGKVAQVDAIKPLSMHKTGLPADSGDHAIAWANKDLRIAFSRKEERRRMLIGAPDLRLPDGSVGFDADLTLVQPPDLESLNIATSWKEKRSAFYLNEKVNCLATSGTVTLGTTTIRLEPDESFGVLDWGRGRWTWRNRWYWASASGMLDGVSFGLNLGYGFSDRTPASENAIIHDRKIHKLGEVAFTIPEQRTDAWKISSEDGRVELDFRPVADRSSYMNFLLVKSDQHQLFGHFSGTVVLDDGTKLTLTDFPGFAEEVYNRY
ncbi:MAG: DUF2804 domain-containing protein, partial [Sphaerochaetaceae bacterium]